MSAWGLDRRLTQTGHCADRRESPSLAPVPSPVRTLVCVACEQEAGVSARGWQAYLADIDDDGRDEVVLVCPSCADREFGEGAWAEEDA
jgi:hypothetical protein